MHVEKVPSNLAFSTGLVQLSVVLFYQFFFSGQPIAVLSAMKMEMVVNAPIGGKVKAIHVNKGHKLEGQDLLMDIE